MAGLVKRRQAEAALFSSSTDGSAKGPSMIDKAKSMWSSLTGGGGTAAAGPSKKLGYGGPSMSGLSIASSAT